MHRYKQVVTNYLDIKMEIRNSLFLHSVQTLVKTVLIMEFGSSHGAIHFHGLVYQQRATYGHHNIDALVSTSVSNLANDIIAAVDELDNFIDDQYEESDAFPCCPTLNLGKDDMNIREEFCTSINGGDECFKHYRVEIDDTDL